MTQRERVMVTSLLGVAIVGGGALLFHVTFLAPLRQLNTEIAAIDEEIRKKEEELNADQATIDRAMKLSPRLAKWKQLSLPGAKDNRPEELLLHLKSKQVDYEQYLYELMQRNGFSPGTISVTPKTLEAPRTGPGAAKGPPPVFRTLPFNVQGQANLDGVVKMLEEFHRANLLQQVRAINVQKPSDRQAPRGALDLTMSVEALLVVGADRRESLMSGSSSDRPHVLAESARTYSELGSHNIFTGSSQNRAATVQSEDARDVLAFVKLTTVSKTNDRRWEGWLRDQARKDGETRLRTSAGFNEFSYSDRYENVLVKALVIRIDQEGVLFKANGKFYLIRPGDNLFEAMREPATAPLAAAGAALGAIWEAPW